MSYLIVSSWQGQPDEVESVETISEAYQAREKNLGRNACRVDIAMLIESAEQ